MTLWRAQGVRNEVKVTDVQYQCMLRPTTTSMRMPTTETAVILWCPSTVTMPAAQTRRGVLSRAGQTIRSAWGLIAEGSPGLARCNSARGCL
eukprot:521029-Amphidinium_carterae.1